VLALALVTALAALPGANAQSARGSTLAPGWDETAPTWSPGGGALLVQRDWESPKSGSFYELTVVDVDGERRRIGRPERRLIEEWDIQGEWSPDGSLVAFIRSVGLGDALYVYVSRADGTGQRRLSATTGSRDHSPTWAPDGQRLAFVRDDRIATIRVDGGDANVITSGDDHSPRWSPDGERIAFLRAGTRSGSEAVFVVRPDGSGLRRLAADGDYQLGGWSPDSSRLLAVTGPATGRDRVVVLRADRAGRLALGPGTAPDWSPSGDRVAFYRPDGLYVAPSSGGAARRVYRFSERRSVNDEDAVGPDWSRNGRRLAFAQRGGCIAWGVYLLDLASGRAERISNDCHIAGTPRRDVLRGTHERDVVRALGGDDVVDANPGDRRIEYYGRLDDDLIDGGPGADTIRGRRGHDVLRGGPGNDRLLGDRGSDRLAGGPGDDFLEGGRFYDRLDGGRGADIFVTRDGYRDRIRCGPGHDRVRADRVDTVASDCELVARAPA
jgi:Tol biopolymer transport system component